MATNKFEVPDKYFDRLTWNMIYFIQKSQVVFSLKKIMKYVGFSIIYQNMLQGNVLPWLPTI